jgi:hypothetical protein
MEKQSRRVASLALRGCDVTKADRAVGEPQRLGDLLKLYKEKVPSTWHTSLDDMPDDVCNQFNEQLRKSSDPAQLKV